MAFTTQQHEAADKAWDILTEHFDGVLLVLMSECGENEPQEALKAYWHGGRIQALGMCERVKHDILTMEDAG